MKFLLSLFALFQFFLPSFDFKRIETITAGIKEKPIMFWDPYILKEGNDTHLFFGTLFCKKGSQYNIAWNPQQPTDCQLKDVIFAIGYGYRKNGSGEFIFRKQPVLYPGTIGSWDDNYIETPSVVKVKNKYYLFYSAWNKRQWKRYQIGVAMLKGSGELQKELLEKNRQFKRLLAEPLLPRSSIPHRFDRDNTQEPSVIFKDGTFELFYIGIRASKKGKDIPSGEPIGEGPLRDSQSIFEELGFGQACFNSELKNIPCKNQLAKEALLTTTFKGDNFKGDYINIPEIRYFNGRYYLFYTDFSTGKGPLFKGNEIKYRTSVNLIDWSWPKLVLGPSTKGEDNWGLSAPTFAFGDNSIELYYSGWGLFSPSKGDLCLQDRFRIALNLKHSQCVSSNLGYARSSL